MDFGIIYQLKTKKFWWLNTIFYFVIAFLLATIICFVMFTVKIYFQENKLKELEGSIAKTGTADQKESEKKVFEYQKKIDSFAAILASHKIPTNVLKLFEKITLPDVWFNNFLTTTQTAEIKVLGEAENTTALSRQLSIFEQSEFIKKVANLTSESTETGRVRFSIDLSLSPEFFLSFFDNLMQPEGILETTSPSTSLFLNLYSFDRTK